MAPLLCSTPNILFIVKDVHSQVIRFFAGQIMRQSRDQGTITVQLYKPVEPLLEKAGAPLPAHKEEHLARQLAVAISQNFVRIQKENIISMCNITDCPIEVRTAYALGQVPVLFNVGVFQTDGRLCWNRNCSSHGWHESFSQLTKSVATA